MSISVKSVRVKHLMSQYELAKAIGVNPSAVSQWESGKTHPRFDKIRKMIDLFGCTAEDLMRED